MTEEELDALVRDAVLAADCMQETGTFETGQGILHDCATAITTRWHNNRTVIVHICPRRRTINPFKHPLSAVTNSSMTANIDRI